MGRRMVELQNEIEYTKFPLMPAPSPSGEATVRALTSTEAGAWLRMLLGNPQVDNPELKISSHSLKSTCLSYLAKRGVSFEDRLALGYHTSAFKMTLTYSRDGAARPLAVLCAMLHEIRNNMYKPDETRSGRLQRDNDISSAQAFLSRAKDVWPPAQSGGMAVEVSVPSNVEASNGLEKEVSDVEHVTTGSSSSSEAETVVKPSVYARVMKLPPGTTGWQHTKLRTVHLSLPGYSRALARGRLVGKFHEKVGAKPLPFDTPTCRQCFHSKLLDDADA